MKRTLSEEFKRMQKLAGLITESQHVDAPISEDDTIDEGLKGLLTKGLIVLATLGGIGKVYQMDQEAKKDKEKKLEYYNKVLDGPVDEMSEDDLFNLGADLNKETKALTYTRDMTVDDPDFMENYKKVIIQYARNYIQANPDKFAVGVDGKIHRISK